MKKFLKDYLWDAWFQLPKCRRIRKQYEESARARFDYRKNGDMSLITTNCLGGEIYHILGLKMLTPFVNMSMDRNDLVKLAIDPLGFCSSSLRFIGRNKRGEWVAELQSVKSKETIILSFPHEKDRSSIYQNFERRKIRVNYDNLYFITDDCGLSDESYAVFEKIKCTNKLIFTAADMSDEYNFTYQLKAYAGGYL